MHSNRRRVPTLNSLRIRLVAALSRKADLGPCGKIPSNTEAESDQSIGLIQQQLPEQQQQQVSLTASTIESQAQLATK